MAEDALTVNAGLARLGPFRLLEALGLRHERDGRAALLHCPFHAERTPSARLRIGPEGTLQLRCHGACQRSWDALALVAQALGLSTEANFVEVLVEGARLAGLFELEADLARDLAGLPRGARQAPRPVLTLPPAPPPRDYPPRAEVEALWAGARSLADVAGGEAYRALEARGISPERAADADGARVLGVGDRLPRWASYRSKFRAEGRPWPELGYRLVLPAYDHLGALRSVRAWRVGEPVLPTDPKRLPPAWHRADGLVLACRLGRLVLATGRAPAGWPAGEPLRVLVTEGEPDWLTMAAHYSDAHERAPAVFGVFSGSWSDEIASRVPSGARVVVCTHADDAGEKYARLVYETLGRRCDVRRRRPDPEASGQVAA